MCLESLKDLQILVEMTFCLFSKSLQPDYSFVMYLYFLSADRCVVLGAQRDAWGKGYTKATVGTSVLMELAKAVRDMVEKGNRNYITLCFCQSQQTFLGQTDSASTLESRFQIWTSFILT